MENYDIILKEIEQQEKDLQFSEFTHETALEIGNILIELAKKDNLAVTFDITRNGHQLFHYACEGTSPDYDRWIKGKIKVVTLVNKSSHYVEILLKKLGQSIDEAYHLDTREYFPDGGCFPIRIKNVGLVGTITVSGLTSKEDHRLAVRAIEEYLNRHK